MTKGQFVRTVLGDISPDAVGPALVHEHLVIDNRAYWDPASAPEAVLLPIDESRAYEVRRNPFAVWADLKLDDLGAAIAELQTYHGLGGATVVDVTPTNLGRDVRALARIAKASGVAVVASSGYYIRASYWNGFEDRSEDSLLDEFVRELTVGVRETGIRTGILGEAGAGSFPMHDVEARVLRAAARAQQVVGCGIVVHPAPGEESAFEILDVLESAGADLRRVVVSHLDERFRSDLTLYKRAAARGCVLGLDTFGRELYFAQRGRQHPSDSDRIGVVAELVSAGLGSQVILSQDICWQHELRKHGGHGYTHVLETIVPILRLRGIDDVAIAEMLTDNPRRLLALGAALN